ncbi:MAG: hypothetical protein ACR2RE_31650 [Geminicoccaceae bacterium]
MIMRLLVASTVLAGQMAIGSASAQVLFCPEVPPADIADTDRSAEAERLLKRLTIALDLHGHRGISEGEIMQTHAETPSALLDKLTNVANDCTKASGDPEDFHAALPELRKAFLVATDMAETIDVVEDEAEQPEIKEAARDVEQSIDLSVRELWRKLWFRSVESGVKGDERWAVIVASPSDADSGWDDLGEHQREWKDAYFQLHIPYYETNPHHAIVVGRRLPREQAEQLREYVIELGMATDSYLWPLPIDEVSEPEEAPASAELDVDDTIDALPLPVDGVSDPEGVPAPVEVDVDDTVSEQHPDEGGLDLSILEQ